MNKKNITYRLAELLVKLKIINLNNYTYEQLYKIFNYTKGIDIDGTNNDK